MAHTEDNAAAAPASPEDDPMERGTPAGKVEDLIELAEETGASTDPEDSEVGEAQLQEPRT